MALHLRPVERADMAELLRMIKGLALHEGRPDAVTITEEKMCDVFLPPKPLASAFFIINQDKTVGYVVTEDKISSFTGERVLYIEDIFVDSVFRGSGIGTAVMANLAAHATKQKYDSMSWSALSGNLSAIAFYDSMKANREADRVHFGFTKEQMFVLAQEG